MAVLTLSTLSSDPIAALVAHKAALARGSHRGAARHEGTATHLPGILCALLACEDLARGIDAAATCADRERLLAGLGLRADRWGLGEHIHTPQSDLPYKRS